MESPGSVPNVIQATGLQEMAQSQPSFRIPILHDLGEHSHIPTASSFTTRNLQRGTLCPGSF